MEKLKLTSVRLSKGTLDSASKLSLYFGHFTHCDLVRPQINESRCITPVAAYDGARGNRMEVLHTRGGITYSRI